MPVPAQKSVKLPAVSDRGGKGTAREAATVGGGQEWSVSTFLLNAALLEEYVKQAKDREDIIAALRLELEMQKQKLKNLTSKSMTRFQALEEEIEE